MLWISLLGIALSLALQWFMSLKGRALTAIEKRMVEPIYGRARQFCQMAQAAGCDGSEMKAGQLTIDQLRAEVVGDMDEIERHAFLVPRSKVPLIEAFKITAQQDDGHWLAEILKNYHP